MLRREGAVRVEVVRASRRADGMCIAIESSAVAPCNIVKNVVEILPLFLCVGYNPSKKWIFFL